MGGCRAKGAPAATPVKADFTGPVVVDPITRIEGHLRIETDIQNGMIANARSSSQLFRGLEIILQGRDPRDAQHFTQRSCGVCTYVHALASTRCVENAVGVRIPDNARLIRNIVMGSQYLHDHIVHFYHLHALDWVNVANGVLNGDPKKAAALANAISDGKRKATAAEFAATQKAIKEKLIDTGQLGIFANAYFLGDPHEAYYLPAEADLMATHDYLKALRIQVKAARMMAMYGAKNPHTQFTVVGGCSNYNCLDKKWMDEYRQLLAEVKEFVEIYYIPDLIAVASFYKDWGAIGGCQNFISFGEFPENEEDLESRWFPPGVVMGQQLKAEKFEPSEIAEHVEHSWYQNGPALHPYEGVTEPKYTSLEDHDRYSWMKAPRYKGKAMETGPLAHVLVAYLKGQPECKTYVDYVLKTLDIPVSALFSTLGRTAARGIECVATAQKIGGWVDQLEANVKKGDDTLYTEWTMPKSARGVGFVGAPRGGLSHWINIENGKIGNFQLVVPSTWNLGPRSSDNVLGPTEESLMNNTPIFDPERPVEILRTVHSFDPCIACGVHVIDKDNAKEYDFKIL